MPTPTPQQVEIILRNLRFYKDDEQLRGILSNAGLFPVNSSYHYCLDKIIETDEKVIIKAKSEFLNLKTMRAATSLHELSFTEVTLLLAKFESSVDAIKAILNYYISNRNAQRTWYEDKVDTYIKVGSPEDRESLYNALASVCRADLRKARHPELVAVYGRVKECLREILSPKLAPKFFNASGSAAKGAPNKANQKPMGQRVTIV